MQLLKQADISQCIRFSFKETIFNQEIKKNDTIIMNGLNIITGEGVWINIKTDDNTVFANMAGYYVNV